MLNFISNQINVNFKMKILFHIHMTDKKINQAINVGNDVEKQKE